MNKIDKKPITRIVDGVGRILIPRQIRERMGIKPGEEFVFQQTPDGILMKRAIYDDDKWVEDVRNCIDEMIHKIYEVNPNAPYNLDECMIALDRARNALDVRGERRI